jgi:nitrogen regulatory protein PII
MPSVHRIQSMLKLIRCVVPLENWEAIVMNLVSIGADINLYQTHEESPDRMRIGVYRGHEYEIHLPGLVLEIITDESWVADMVRTIEADSLSLTGSRAIEIFPIEESYRIRDGFMDAR